MAEVRVQEGEPLENALRRFKRKVQAEDIIKEVKRVRKTKISVPDLQFEDLQGTMIETRALTCVWARGMRYPV